jgi:hypothetical protein
MKKLFVCCLLFVSNLVLAQTYHPLIRPGLNWQILHADGTYICHLYGGDHYYFQGDTTGIGHTYTVIRSFPIVQVNSGPYCPPFIVDPSGGLSPGFLIREDTSTRKVYYYDYQSQTDGLLYDFNLVAGDTLFTGYTGSTPWLIVDSVSTVTLLNGEIRKIFYFPNGIYYIESVGGWQGLQFYLLQGLGFWDEPVCMKENGVMIWGMSSQCYGFVGLEEMAQQQNAMVSPNPTSGLFTINWKDQTPLRVKVYNSQSQKVIDEDVGPTRQIDIRTWPSGMYYYQLETSAGKITAGKLIKE